MNIYIKLFFTIIGAGLITCLLGMATVVNEKAQYYLIRAIIIITCLLPILGVAWMWM